MGRRNREDVHEPFNMADLALREEDVTPVLVLREVLWVGLVTRTMGRTMETASIV